MATKMATEDGRLILVIDQFEYKVIDKSEYKVLWFQLVQEPCIQTIHYHLADLSHYLVCKLAPLEHGATRPDVTQWSQRPKTEQGTTHVMVQAPGHTKAKDRKSDHTQMTNASSVRQTRSIRHVCGRLISGFGVTKCLKHIGLTCKRLITAHIANWMGGVEGVAAEQRGGAVLGIWVYGLETFENVRELVAN